jgi:hypothetical protein
MAIGLTKAIVTLQSMSPYTQSRNYEEPFLEGESKGDYDKRNWRKHLHTKEGIVYIPARAIQMALADGAKYSKKQIPGQGKATWTAKFASGIAIFEDISLSIHENDVDFIDIYANADGIRGSGKRVMRRFPIIPSWKSTFEVQILDEIITKDVFEEIFEIAGLYIGIGQYRPQNTGTSGRFKLIELEWMDARKPIGRRSMF